MKPRCPTWVAFCSTTLLFSVLSRKRKSTFSFLLIGKSRVLPPEPEKKPPSFFKSTKLDIKDHELLSRYYRTSLTLSLKNSDSFYVPTDLIRLIAEFCGGKPTAFLKHHHLTRSFDDFFEKYVKYYNSPRCYVSPVVGQFAVLRKERLGEIGLLPVTDAPKNLSISARMEVFFGILDEVFVFVTFKADITGKTELRVICENGDFATLGFESVVYRLDQIGIGVHH